jgi:hypothetical protein
MANAPFAAFLHAGFSGDLEDAGLRRGQMQISRLSAGPPGAAANTTGVAAAAALLNDPAGAAGLDRQLAAYQALAGRWRDARPAERDTLAQALTQSPFAQRVQSTLNAFTRAAWAGPDAVPPKPQARILEAFDRLPEDDQRIVAAMQADAAPADYRTRLQAELDAHQPAPSERRADSVTLSQEAQDRLAAGETAPEPAQPRPEPRPDLAAALAAYAKAGG